MITPRLLAVVALVAPACFLDHEPDVGRLAVGPDAGGDAGPGAADPCRDSDPATTVSFAADIVPLLARSPGGCRTCHGASAVAGLNLGSYEGLRRGGVLAGARTIVPGQPCASALVDKLGPTPAFGARMPYNGPPYYTAAEVTLVRDWIAEGAGER